MQHPILAKLNDIETDLTRLPDHVSQDVCAEARGHIFAARAKLLDALDPPKPGSTTQVAGATITHRPDLAYDERARQAQAQGVADRGMYAPVREELAKDGEVVAAIPNAHEVHEPTPSREAERATIGIERR